MCDIVFGQLGQLDVPWTHPALVDQLTQQGRKHLLGRLLLVVIVECLVEEEVPLEVGFREVRGKAHDGHLGVDMLGVRLEEVGLGVIVESFKLHLVDGLRPMLFLNLHNLNSTSRAFSICRCIAIQFYSKRSSLLMKGSSLFNKSVVFRYANNYLSNR